MHKITETRPRGSIRMVVVVGPADTDLLLALELPAGGIVARHIEFALGSKEFVGGASCSEGLDGTLRQLTQAADHELVPTLAISLAKRLVHLFQRIAFEDRQGAGPESAIATPRHDQQMSLPE